MCTGCAVNVQDELRSIEEERDRRLREGDDEIEELNKRLAAGEKLGRDLRAEMHRLQQRVLQTRTRIGKYKVSIEFVHLSLLYIVNPG